MTSCLQPGAMRLPNKERFGANGETLQYLRILHDNEDP